MLLEEANSLGAAIIGGVGVGIFEDFDVAEKIIKINTTIQPNKKNSQIYKRQRKVFNACYFALEQIFYEM